MVIDPGDKIAIQILFTGYGYIESPKFVFYPPTDFIKTGQVTHGIRTDSNSKGSSIHGWGAQTDTIKPTGVIMILSGLISRQNPDSIKAYRSIFFDWPRENSNFKIFPEHFDKDNKTAPITFNLETANNAAAGNHTLNFYLTYFNGKEWKISVASQTIRVRNFYERNQELFWIIGTTIALFGLFVK